MTMLPIIESEMTFGPYPDGHCFAIEECATYKKVNKGAKSGEGIKIAEFLLIRTDNNHLPVIWIVEAKKSTPSPNKQQDFDDFIEEIRQKLTNTFFLGMSMFLGRHKSTYDEFPEPFKSVDISIAKFKIVLVINGHNEAWLPPLQDAVYKAIYSTINKKIWNLSPDSVAVINDKMALQIGLISSIAESSG